jgi:8-oxo-dGTP diphosphatase
MNVYLVRHGQALARGEWEGPDELRPLSSKGQRQAQRLAESFGEQPVVRVVSSPAVRCRQTVEPLAAAHGLDVEESPSLVEGAPIAKALRLVFEAAAGATNRGGVVLCSHGDVIPEVLSQLRARGMKLHDEMRWSKASAWAVEWDGNRFTAGRYLPPPH